MPVEGFCFRARVTGGAGRGFGRQHNKMRAMQRRSEPVFGNGGRGGGYLAAGAVMARGFVGHAVAAAVHSLQRVQSPVVRTLGLRTNAQVRAEAAFFFLRERLGDSGLGAIVMAADVIPEIAVDTADAEQVPPGMGELLDENALVRVFGGVSLLQAALKFLELGRILGGEEVRFVGCHRNVLAPQLYHEGEIDSEIAVV